MMSDQPVESPQALQVVQTHPVTDVGPVTKIRDHYSPDSQSDW